MKRQWLLLLFPLVLVGLLLTIKHFAKKPEPPEAEITKPVALLKDTTIQSNVPMDVVPRNSSALQPLAPEVVEKITGTLEKYVKEHPSAPDIADAYFNLGNAYLNHNKYEEAIERYKQALALNPNNGAAHYVLGVAYGRQHRFKDASDEFEKAVSIDPNNPEARYLLAMAKFENGDRKGAMEQYESLKKLSPQYAD